MKPHWVQALPACLRARLEGRFTLQKIIGNTGWLFADRLSRMGVELSIGVWVARYLGPGQFGLFNYALAFVKLFGPLATLGLDTIVVRDLVRDPAGREETLGTALGLKLLGGGAALVSSVAAIGLLRPGDGLTRGLVAIIAAGLVIQSLDAIDLWFQSQVQSRYTVPPKNAAFVLIALVKVVLIQLRAPLIAFALAGLAEIALGAVGLMIAYRMTGQRLGAWRFSLRRARQLLAACWPLLLSGVAIMIYMKIDQVMLGSMVGDQAVGVYAAAARISEVWYFIPTAIVASAFPAIVEARKVNETDYYRHLQNLFDLMAGLAFALAVPMTFFSGLVVHVLYGPAYAGAAPILTIHIWAALFVFLGVAQSPWDTTEGLTRLALLRTAAGALVNVAVNLVLLPAYAGLGAAIATVVAYAVSACLANVMDGRTRQILRLQMRAIFLARYWHRPSRA